MNQDVRRTVEIITDKIEYGLTNYPYNATPDVDYIRKSDVSLLLRYLTQIRTVINSVVDFDLQSLRG